MDLLGPVLIAEASVNELGPMIDSGAHTSVCPPSFVASSPVMPGRNIQLVSVTGEPLQIIGEKMIELEEKQLDQKVVKNFARFVVADVRRPIRAVAEMVDDGWEVHFGKQNWMRKGNSSRPADAVVFERVGNQFYDGCGEQGECEFLHDCSSRGE